MNNLDKSYQSLLQDILDNGYTKSDRTGTGTISVFGRQIRHNMKDGFPLLTTKKMAWKTMVTELLWFLRGDTNIKYLVDNNCHIWNGDAYKNYVKHFENLDPMEKLSSGTILIGSLEPYIPFTKEEFIDRIKNYPEFAKKWGELGPVYGRQWRGWNNLKWEATDKVDPSHPDRPMLKWKLEGVDQIANLINDLKTNPDSRRLMVNAWNVGELDQMVLPPCHYGFQVYTRELSEIERGVLYSKKMEGFVDTDDLKTNEHYDKMNIPKRAISLMWNQRSCDVPLGIPMNISSYALLLMMIADEVNMVPDELIGNLGDCHIYLNQMEGVKEQIGREPYPLPKVSVRDGIFCSSVNDVILENYQSHPKIYFPLSN